MCGNNKLLKAAIYGLAVGDALGVPFEFQERGTFTVKGMASGGIHKQPLGTWSDDTSLTLATCYSIKEKGGIDLDHLMQCFRSWLWYGAFAINNRVFDSGNTCAQAINMGHGLGRENKQGNGSLMRILPLAFLPNMSDETIANVSALTHDSSVCKDVCIIYVRIAQALLCGNTLEDAIQHCVKSSSGYADLLNIKSIPRERISDTSHAPMTLMAALWCLSHTSSYKQCVLEAVALGDDTDTVAAIAGGLAGILYGFNSIPKLWCFQLRGKQIIKNCLF